MKTEKARIATVKLGNLEIEGLMLPSGEFAIGLSQIPALLPDLVRPNQASRTVKRLLGKESPFDQIKAELNSKPINYVLLKDLEKIIVLSASKGSKDALNLNLILVGCSLTQFWSDAFGVKFEEEQRVKYVASRQEHYKNFHTRLTRWWKSDGCVEGWEYAARVKEFKEAVGLPKNVSVDDYDENLLYLMNQKETAYHALRRAGLSHDDSLKFI